MATTPAPQPEQATAPASVQFLQPYESDQLRNLIVTRNASNEAIRGYLFHILGQRGLDPNKYGVSSDLRSFVEIQPAPAPTIVPPVEAAPEVEVRSDVPSQG